MEFQRKLTLKELPEEIRPRERLLHSGAETLSTTELMAILLQSGTPQRTALDLAEELLSRFGSLDQLAKAKVADLLSVKGVGPAKAVRVVAALELGKRLLTAPPTPRPAIRSPHDVARLLMPEMRMLDREHFRVILLDTKHRVLGIVNISVGSLNATTVHPREVFKEAIRKSAAAVVLVHNHPSGQAEPSREDMRITEQLQAAGEIVGIKVVDHIILGDGQFYSFREHALLA
ncbi:MAG: DNA repair protein RadC [Armatimonadota bacterium]|nr:DNA repair protein RadC [Armatimonadota bacterium]